jgi:hypothetical protein
VVVAQITITVDDGGQMNVAGSLENKMIAYGMLEVAKEVVKHMHDENARRIQAATPDERARILSAVK